MPSPEHDAIAAALAAQEPPETPPSIEQQRAVFEKQFAGWPLASGVSVEAVDAGGVPAEWIAAEDAEPGRTLLYLHGGGYMLGSVATHRNLVGRIARKARARCLSLDYRLAPEHPFPAAIEDSLTAYRWLLGSGVDPARLAIGGDSAGGGLTLGTLVSLRDAGDPLPACALCLSPLTDLEGTGDSMRTADDPLIAGSSGAVEQMTQTYLQGGDPRDPRASPLHADYAGFPPLLIEVGTREVLLDDSTRVAAKAREAGVDVTLQVEEGLIHVWQLFGPSIPESRSSLERIGAFLREHT